MLINWAIISPRGCKHTGEAKITAVFVDSAYDYTRDFQAEATYNCLECGEVIQVVFYFDASNMDDLGDKVSKISQKNHSFNFDHVNPKGHLLYEATIPKMGGYYTHHDVEAPYKHMEIISLGLNIKNYPTGHGKPFWKWG